MHIAKLQGDIIQQVHHMLIKQKHEEGILNNNNLTFLALNQFTQQFKAESPVAYKA